mmetsp:Transcript_16898/g.21377  ORF Transcript_16898/g.21377 Transcript_16898/m.21377 type:complete len:130 (+) Transcript_16898:58-447(+)
MPFWSRGKESESPSAKDFTSSDEASFSSGSNMMSQSSSSSLGGVGAGPSAADLQQFAVAVQEQVIIQETISAISQKAMEKCMTAKPSESLSGREAACIAAVTNKWLDTTAFMQKRLAKKMQAGQSEASF